MWKYICVKILPFTILRFILQLYIKEKSIDLQQGMCEAFGYSSRKVNKKVARNPTRGHSAMIF